MTIVDSSVWINFFNGFSTRESDHLDLILQTELVGIGDIILVETLQGFRSAQDYKIAEKVLRPLPVFDFLGSKRVLKGVENYQCSARGGSRFEKRLMLSSRVFALKKVIRCFFQIANLIRLFSI